jgi:hypothetical protein
LHGLFQYPARRPDASFAASGAILALAETTGWGYQEIREMSLEELCWWTKEVIRYRRIINNDASAEFSSGMGGSGYDIP